MSDDSKSTRVSLTRRELLQLVGFAENVDDFDNAAFWDRLVDKLERAISRIDETEPPARRQSVVSPDLGADMRPALCRACGWEGELTKTSPCPTCGQKVNPLLFSSRSS